MVNAPVVNSHCSRQGEKPEKRVAVSRSLRYQNYSERFIIRDELHANALSVCLTYVWFPSKRNARNASDCVWMETGLYSWPVSKRLSMQVSSLAVAETVASTHCAYPRRDGQAEFFLGIFGYQQRHEIPRFTGIDVFKWRYTVYWYRASPLLPHIQVICSATYQSIYLHSVSYIMHSAVLTPVTISANGLNSARLRLHRIK